MRGRWVIVCVALGLGTLALAQEVLFDLLLAQMCVAEIGLTGKNEECQLMWSVLEGRSFRSKKSFRYMVNNYNTLMRRRKGGREWVLGLNAESSEPNHWPQKDKWVVWRPAWQGRLETARKWLADKPPHPCPRAVHYGARCDNHKFACDEVPACYVRVWCGKPRDYFAQAYWHVPKGCKPVKVLRRK